MEDFYGDGSLNQFSSDRTRVQQTTGGIEKNNRRVRLLNFERAMKAQFGPNVVVSPDGTASRNGKVVGQIDTFLKGGGQLQGTPKDPRSQLQIRKDENKKLRENYVAPTFEETMEGLFPKADERISSKTFESTDEGVDVGAISQYTDTGGVDTDFSPDMFNTSTGSSSAGTNGTSTRDRLKSVGPAGISDRNVPEGYIRTGGKLQSVKSVEGQRAKMRLDRLRKLQANLKKLKVRK